MITMLKLDDIKFQKNNEWIKDNILYLGIHGSHCYGLANENSDIDVRGIAFGKRSHYFGISESFSQWSCSEPYDATIFEIKKFFTLASKCNPNALEIIFVNPEHMIHVTEAGKILIQNRNIFLSKKIRYTLSGYAFSQLKRLNNHYHWLINPPTHLPTREEFGLPSYNELQKDKINIAFSIIQDDFANWDFDWQILEPEDRIALQNSILNHLTKYHLTEDILFNRGGAFYNFNSDFMELLRQERKYRSALQTWKDYNKWKETRNEKRAALEAKFGYDSKHASHLMRLMKMCEEVLTTGQLNVNRSNIDAPELIDIKTNGAITYEELIKWAEQQEAKIATLYNQCTILPNSADMNQVNAILEELLATHLYKR